MKTNILPRVFMISAFVILPASAEAQSVYHPDASTEWHHGQTNTYVSWSTEGFYLWDELSITLMRYVGGMSQYEVVDDYCGDTENDGMVTRSEAIPASWGTGTNFAIVINDQHAHGLAFSQHFSIFEATPTPPGYKTPSPTPTITPTPEGYRTPSPTPSVTASPSPAPRAVPFSEDFEGTWESGAPQLWTKEFISGFCDWTQAAGNNGSHPPSAHGGDYNALFVHEMGGGWTTRLITPRLDFGILTANTRLTFWYAMEESMWSNELGIYYKDSYESSWTLLTKFDSSVPEWTERTIPLPDPSDDYYVCFQGTYWDEYGVCVDDVFITGETPPTPAPSPTPSVSPEPSPSPSVTPTTTITPLNTPTPSVSPTPTCGPTVPLNRMVIESGDYDGDGTDDVAVFRPSSGLWAVRGLTRTYFGDESDHPAPGDYRGNGSTLIAVFRPSSRLWAVRGFTRLYFGDAGDLPVPGDYDGDGSADIGIYRGSTGLWAVRNLTRIYFGSVDDWPIPADYLGDGTQAVAVRRPPSGLWALKGITRVYYGNSSDWPRLADCDGDLASDIVIFRPSSGLWAVRGLTRVYYGCCLDWPQTADFDGNSTDDIIIFRGVSSLWSARGITRIYYGTSGDIPVTR